MSNPRIIGGTARGIRLQSVPGDSTRPITDMVKEALFNILGLDVEESTWLDMFGGTGSVGIEALSRGGKFVRFIDLNRSAVTTIKTNLEKTRLSSKAEVLQGDSFAFLKRNPDRLFDYVFIAPPQYKGMWQRAMRILDSNLAWIDENSWVIVQIDPVEYEKLEVENLEEFMQRKYGNTLLLFYQTKSDESEEEGEEEG